MKNIIEKIDFGNEAGEDIPPSEIESFFVEQATFSSFADSDKKILIATAKKGVGKSALLRWLQFKISNYDDSIVIACRGRDLVRSNFSVKGEPKTANEFINDWMIRICSLINFELAKRINFAFSDDNMSIIEAAEIQGFKQRNIVSALADRLKGILGSISRERPEIGNQIELLKRIQNKNVWILVDDLDATYQRTDRENLEISTFFSACRYLSSEISGIKFRVTMRTDVWVMMRRYDEALDKVEQYVTDITWSQADFRQLLYRRILSQVKAQNIQISKSPEHVSETEIEEYYINLVFAKRMPWGDAHEERTYKILYTLSYHRPRWAIQLCKLAQKETIKRKGELIERSDIDEVWGFYGKKRIEDLIVEHRHQCKEIEELINAFRGAERRMQKPILLDWIRNKITEHMTPVIEGKSTKDLNEIAHFLFRIGFLQARIQIDKDRYEHYSFSDMPSFLRNRTNNDFGSTWEIHPCYREALDIVKLNKWQSKNRNMAR